MGRNQLSRSRDSKDMAHTSGRSIRIGLVADTHEAAEPWTLIEELGKQKCDFYVHLGDIGGSQLTTRFVHEFKRTLGNLDHLGRKDRERYEKLRSQGLTPIWSYIEMRMGDSLDLRKQRMDETVASYSQVIGGLSKLKPVYFVSGNIDRALAGFENIKPLFEKNGVTLISEPKTIDLGDQAVILWPSMKVLNQEFARQLDEIVDDLGGRLRSKKRAVVLAHEQLFKGPPPNKYAENVERAGFKALTVPYFEPSPTWRHLLKLFRSLPPSVDLAFVHGHVHDPCYVIQAGAPYLKGTGEFGLEYRLHGINSGCDGVKRGRRVVRIFCVPANEVMVLKLETQNVRIESVAGGGAWRTT